MATEDEGILDTIRDLKKQEPPVPFTIVMTSGERYVIESPDSLAVGSAQLHYYMPRSDRAVHLRINQIASIEEPSEKPAA